MNGMLFMSLAQSMLGVSTLLSLVQTEWAAAHQLGSVLLLTTVLHYHHDVTRMMRLIK